MVSSGDGRGTPAPLARRDVNPAWFVGAALRSAVRLPRTAHGLFLRTVINQIRFTAVQGIPLLVFVAAVFGVPLALSVAPLTAALGVSDAADRILVTLVIRELGPIVAALLVVVRSGTAVVAELAAARVTGERDALEALGVDPLQYYVLPRIVAFAVSVALLSLFFDAVVLGALSIARVRAGGGADFASLLATSAAGADVWLTVVKGMLFGAGIATFASMEGLEAGDNAVAIPIAVSRGTVQAFVWVFLASAVLAAIRFLA